MPWRGRIDRSIALAASPLRWKRCRARGGAAASWWKQLYLAAEICLDRNYVAIELVSGVLPYETCVTAIKSDALPHNIKAAFVRLVNTVYVDCDPQVVIPIPRLSHSFVDIGSVDDVKLSSVETHRQHCFWLLQDVIAEQLDELGRGTTVEWDSLTQMTMQLLHKLVQARRASVLGGRAWG